MRRDYITPENRAARHRSKMEFKADRRQREYAGGVGWFARQTKALAELFAWRQRQSIWPKHKGPKPGRMA